MKTIATLAVLAAVAFVSIAAQAQSTDATSRSAVSAELQRARANGELDWASAELGGAPAPTKATASMALR